MSRLYSLLERRNREPSYIGTWVDAEDAWVTTRDLTGEDGTRMAAGTRVYLACATNGSGFRPATTQSGLTMSLYPNSAELIDDLEWPAKKSEPCLTQ